MSSAALSAKVDALRTGFTGDPDGLRRYAVDLLCELAPSDGGLWYRFGLVDGDPLPVRWIMRNLDQSMFDRQVDERIPWPHGDPRLAPPRWSRRFLRMRSLLDPEHDLWPTRLYRRCYAPLRITDQLRLVVFHRGEFVGWIGVLHRQGEPDFQRRDVRRVAPLAGVLSDALITAEATERAGLCESADFVLCPDGSVALASEDGRTLLRRPYMPDELRTWARKADAGATPTPLVRGHHVRWSRLHGSEGTRYLLHLEPVGPLSLSPAHVLTSTQRGLAELAAAGATVREIAEMEDLAVSTVRSHLRQAYERLGVQSRAELARALDPA